MLLYIMCMRVIILLLYIYIYIRQHGSVVYVVMVNCIQIILY